MRRDLIIHETSTEPPPDGDDEPIHETFQRLVDDDQRTTQICSDVRTAIQQGRVCLVLTQRTEHIDHLVADLRERGLQPLVLRGGLGKKARTAVTDALKAHQAGGAEEGIVLVATGSYLGEGFDWPALDTLPRLQRNKRLTAYKTLGFTAASTRDGRQNDPLLIPPLAATPKGADQRIRETSTWPPPVATSLASRALPSARTCG